MARVTFDSLFVRHPDGSLEPRQRIRVGGVEFGPGVRFSKGVAFAGIDFTLFTDRELEVEEHGDVKVISGVYR